MAPYEYRVKCTPIATEQQAWVVEIWVRKTTATPDEGTWNCKQRVQVNGRDWPHSPGLVWNQILRQLKVLPAVRNGPPGATGGPFCLTLGFILLDLATIDKQLYNQIAGHRREHSASEASAFLRFHVERSANLTEG